MKKKITVAFVLLCLCACHKSDQPAVVADSVITNPLPPAVPKSPVDSAGNFVRDSAQIAAANDEKILSNKSPLTVRDVYEAFWPMRKNEPSDKELHDFLAKNKITHEELLAILRVGDRLGWAEALKNK